MRWALFSDRDRADAAERFRREHEAWLTWAFASGAALPLIPLRRVEPGAGQPGGGFDPMMARGTGRQRAERWWTLALARVDRRPRGIGNG